MAGALIFDLDGTLVDTVYAHVFAWQRALAEEGMPIEGWRIHRRIGMSGGLFTRGVAREVGRELSADEIERIQLRHGTIFRELLPERRPLPGARKLLEHLRARDIVHGDRAETVALGQVQHSELGPTDSHCILQHGFEYRL